MSVTATHGGLPDDWTKQRLLDVVADLGKDGLELSLTAFNLLRHVIVRAAKEDFQPGHICGNWEKVEDLARILNVKVRTILDAEKLLQEKAFILRTAGRNGFRSVRKVSGRIEALRGINLAPTIRKAQALEAQRDARDFAERAVEQLKATADAILRKIHESEDVPARARARALLPCGRLSRVRDADRLEALVSALNQIVEQILSPPPSEDFAGRSEKIACPITESKIPKFSARARDALARLTPATAISFASADYQLLVQARGSVSWASIIEASSRCLPRLQIEQSTWGWACRELGRRQAALCVLAIDRNRQLSDEHERWPVAPGRCLSGMVRQARAQKLNLIGMLHAAQSRQEAMPPVHRCARSEAPPMLGIMASIMSSIKIAPAEFRS